MARPSLSQDVLKHGKFSCVERAWFERGWLAPALKLCLFKLHSVRSLLLGNWKPVQLPKKLNCISWRLISQQWGGPVRWSLIPSQKCLSVVTCFLTHPSPFIKSVVVFWWFQKQLSRPVDQYFSLSPQHRRFLEEINFPLNTELF